MSHVTVGGRHDDTLSRFNDLWIRLDETRSHRRTFTATTVVVQLEHAVGRVCLCVRALTFEQNDLWSRYLTYWFILIISRSCSKVQKIGQRSWWRDGCTLRGKADHG